MSHRYLLIFTFILFIVYSPGRILANESLITLVLFTGKVVLIDGGKKPVPAQVGQLISRKEFPWIQVGKGARVYLQWNGKLVELLSSGTYRFSDIFKTNSMVLNNALSFLKQLATPRAYIPQSRVRGDIDGKTTSEKKIFEHLWQQLALEPPQQPTGFSSEELLATASFFEQHKNHARVAYALERLNMSSQTKNKFYEQLRNESLKRISLTQITDEVEATRKRMNANLMSGNYKALLIGIDEYDHPTWQALKTPVKDVKELKNLLITNYHFKNEDILLLENATYKEIIEAFNTVKQSVDRNTSLLVYFAGHGFYPQGEDEGYWIPRDAGKPETQILFLPTSTILSKIKSIHSRHTLVIADSCFSGSLIRRTRGKETQSHFFQELSRKKSRQIITSGGLEPVSDQGWGGHSIFAGKLIDILSTDRHEPLSASELALNLRKEIKNARGEQTPEYGRLHIIDDEAGEFFFVRKNRQLATINQSKEQRTDLRSEEQEAVELSSIELGLKDGYRLLLGFGFHIALLKLKFKDTSSGKSETTDTSLTGTSMHLGLKKIDKRFRYEVLFSMGKVSASELDCNQNQESSLCDSYSQSSIYGNFTNYSIYGLYHLTPGLKVDVEVGAGFQYQYYYFNKFLDEKNIDSRTMAVCNRVNVDFEVNQWFLGVNSDFCLSTYNVGGSLQDLDTDALSGIQIPGNITINVTAGYQF